MDPHQWQTLDNRCLVSSYHINQLTTELQNSPKVTIILIKLEAIAHTLHLQVTLLAIIRLSFNQDLHLKLQIWLLRCKMKFMTKFHKCLTIASLSLHMANPNLHLNQQLISLIK